MEHYYAMLLDTPLFAGVAVEDLPGLLACAGARLSRYEKGAFITLAGDAIDAVGVVLEGQVQVLKEDVFGNQAILNDLGPGAVFGESFVCGGRLALTVTVRAAEPSAVLFIAFEKILHTCPNACSFHDALVKNMVVMIAEKNLALVEKLEVTTKHSLREKVLTYLSQLAQRQGGARVTSPLGRTNLADFMGADRSALTRELNRMRDEGLIEYKGNEYRLLGVEVPPG